jgi:hypothetical protein
LGWARQGGSATLHEPGKNNAGDDMQSARRLDLCLGFGTIERILHVSLVFRFLRKNRASAKPGLREN